VSQLHRRAPRATPPRDRFIFGTQYYRMVPMPADWKRDLAHIRELGMDAVRFWLFWPWVEREKGDFHLSDIEQLFDGLDFFLGLEVIDDLGGFQEL